LLSVCEHYVNWKRWTFANDGFYGSLFLILNIKGIVHKLYNGIIWKIVSPPTPQLQYFYKKISPRAWYNLSTIPSFQQHTLSKNLNFEIQWSLLVNKFIWFTIAKNCESRFRSLRFFRFNNNQFVICHPSVLLTLVPIRE
jgi:hypothetical protein